jgi:hypothetical protein
MPNLSRMSYASWFGSAQLATIPNNTVYTSVTQNGSNYTTNVNPVPEVISRNTVLSTMVDEANTTFFTASNVQPGLYRAGMFWTCGTGAADLWQPRDYVQFFVASQDYLNNPTNSNAANLYKTKNSVAVPFTEGADPIGGANGSVYGQHMGYLNISSIQNVNFCAYMEDFADNPTTHAVSIADPWLQKIG